VGIYDPVGQTCTVPVAKAGTNFSVGEAGTGPVAIIGYEF